MSDNFLSFIANVPAKAPEVGVVTPNSKPNADAQATDFNSILTKEQAKASTSTAEPTVAPEDDAVDQTMFEKVDMSGSEGLLTNPDAPVALPVASANGNSLPELSIHSRALQVGRVILTTANPRVSEESLSQFARSQGAQIPELAPTSAQATSQGVGPAATATPKAPNILAGLINAQVSTLPTGQETTPALGQAATPVVGMPPQMASVSTLGGNPLDARQRFMQRTGLAQTDVPTKGAEPTQVNMPVERTLAAETVKVTANAQDGTPTVKSEFELMNRPQVETKGASAPMPLVQVEAAAEMSLEANLQDSQGERQPSHASVAAPVNAQNGLIQAPITNTAIGLADALMSSDPAQMQSRLQPYQVWAQRFGEVLAQKLALAVKDGNWTVKLNLNPASLGAVGIELSVSDRGIDGQIAANDANVRQLLGDSMPRLRQSLEALVGENAGVNLELSDGSDQRAKREDSQEIEISMDLLAEELIPSEQEIASGNILRDGLNVFV